MKRLVSIIFYYILFSSPSFAWTINADFEKGTVGTLAQGNSGFNTARSNTFFSDKYSRNGSKSAKANINAGSTSGMGGTFFPVTKPKEGDELWWRCSVYFPSGFQFYTPPGDLKFFRLHTSTADGKSEGYQNILIKNGGAGLNFNSLLAGSTFVENNPDRKGLGPSFTTGVWHTVESYTKFSSSQGTWRVWNNGQLIFEDKKTFTLGSSNSNADRLYMFSYWNDGSPVTQAAYIDDCILTSDTPSNRDASGNPLIGVGDFEVVADPIADPNPPILH